MEQAREVDGETEEEKEEREREKEREKRRETRAMRAQKERKRFKVIHRASNA